MVTKIQKWGNSLGVRIPKSFAQEAKVEAGSTVDLAVKRGQLVIIPIKPREYSLEALLAGIKPSNLHAEVETGELLGRELL